MLEEELTVIINYYFRDKRCLDLPNSPKSVCDAMNKLLWKDDKQIEELLQKRNFDKENPRIELEIYRKGEVKINVEKNS